MKRGCDRQFALSATFLILSASRTQTGRRSGSAVQAMPRTSALTASLALFQVVTPGKNTPPSSELR